MNENLLVFLDCEASSLSDVSYPIEIAWGSPNGSVESYLIRPAFDWNDWSEQAEAIHGLSREMITKDGLPPWIVAARMNESLAGKICYSDAPEFDLFWVQRLFAHYSDEMQFQIRHFDLLILGINPNRLAELGVRARKQAGGKIHRAVSDMKYLIELYKLAQKKSSAA